MSRTIPTIASFASLTVLTACIGSGDGIRAGGADPDSAGLPEPDGHFAVSETSNIQYIHGYLDPALSMQERIAGGAAAGDYDNDGDIDLFIVRGDIGPNLLYQNDGSGTFADVAAAAGVAYTRSSDENYRHSGPTFADMDGDGDLDLFVGGIHNDPCFLFENQGDGTFLDVTAGSGLDEIDSVHTLSAAFGDYDLDGDLDLFLGHWTGGLVSMGDPDDTENLWRNDSDQAGIRFTSVSASAGISPSILTYDRDDSFTPTFARIDDDEYPDLLVVGDYGSSKIYMNNRDGTFSNATTLSPFVDNTNSDMGSAVGDFDNDGDLDWFISAALGTDPFLGVFYGVGNRLYLNDGDGTFSNHSSIAGIVDGGWGWAACSADFNLDGNLDIYHTNGWYTVGNEDFLSDASRLFMSQGDGTFLEMSEAYNIVDTEQGRGVVCADFDNDRDVDVLLLHRDPDNSATLFRNDIAVNNALSIELIGMPPNTEAVGARIRVTVNAVTQTREVVIGSNFTSHDPTRQIFGLGSATHADTVEITWPGGVTETYTDVVAGSVDYTHP